MDLTGITDLFLATAGLNHDDVVATVGEYPITAAELLYWLSYNISYNFGTELPPWDMEEPSLPEEPPQEQKFVPAPPAPEPAPPAPEAEPIPAPAAPSGSDRAFWPSFAAGLRGKVPPSVTPYLNNPAKVTGVWQNNTLTLWTDTDFTRSMLNKPAVLEGLTRAAAAAFGGQPRVNIVTGPPPPEAPSAPPAADALDDLLAFGAQFDNIVIQ